MRIYAFTINEKIGWLKVTICDEKNNRQCRHSSTWLFPEYSNNKCLLHANNLLQRTSIFYCIACRTKIFSIFFIFHEKKTIESSIHVMQMKNKS